MAPPLSKAHLELLNTEFYENIFLFGRDKLYNLLKVKYEDKAPSRRQVADFYQCKKSINCLIHQKVNQKISKVL